MNGMILNVAAICHKTRALGPGIRAVVWVQGCPFRCSGCISPQWIPIIPAQKYHPHKLAENLLNNPEITGLTISGGEPILQASGLYELIKYSRTLREINVIMFSGYYYENLLAFPVNSPVNRLLGVIDVLIDGPYDHHKNNNRGLRGSTNQRIIHISEHLQGVDLNSHPRQMEIHISDGEVLFVGVPPSEVISTVSEKLDQGIESAQVR